MTWRPDYATAAQVKAFLRIVDTDDDAEIGTAITAASRAIDGFTHRQFGKVDAAEQRTYEAYHDRFRPHLHWAQGFCDRGVWAVEIDDLAADTGLVVSVGGVTVTDYTLEPLNANAKGKVYERLVFGPNAEAVPDYANPVVDLTTDQWGWSAVPTPILHACKIQTGRFVKRRDALFGVAGSPQDGSELRLLAKLDPDVQVIIGSGYVRHWAAV